MFILVLANPSKPSSFGSSRAASTEMASHKYLAPVVAGAKGFCRAFFVYFELSLRVKKHILFTQRIYIPSDDIDPIVCKKTEIKCIVSLRPLPGLEIKCILFCPIPIYLASRRLQKERRFFSDIAAFPFPILER